jgi:hypothetical protein
MRIYLIMCVKAVVAKFDMDVLRIDFNIAPGPVWHDTRDAYVGVSPFSLCLLCLSLLSSLLSLCTSLVPLALSLFLSLPISLYLSLSPSMELCGTTRVTPCVPLFIFQKQVRRLRDNRSGVVCHVCL